MLQVLLPLPFNDRGDWHTRVLAQVATQLQQSRNYAAKEIQFGSEGRASMQRGVERLANAVEVTLGPKVKRTTMRNAYVLESWEL